MASLMENLIDILERQYKEYEVLLELSKEKTNIIVKGDLELLAEMSDREQNAVNVVLKTDKERETVMKDIANVLNKDEATLKISDLVTMLSTRPEERKRLDKARADLNSLAYQLKKVNERNRELIENSLELVNFDMNLIQAMKQAPETANYTRGAYNSGDIIGINEGSFDAKQ